MTIPEAPNGNDPVTLVHWLWWKLRCHEGSAEDFQKMFENVIKLAHPEFMQIRPYGNIGDRKCDGLFFEAGVVFQVYSPDELKQAEVQAKIEEDLAGAVDHWRDKGLKRWVFVYNCRRGLPPDIPATLNAQRAKFPSVELDHLSSDALWEKARGLTLQQRCEILGAPFGYEHLFMLPDGTAGDAIDKIRRGHFVVVHDVMSPISTFRRRSLPWRRTCRWDQRFMCAPHRPDGLAKPRRSGRLPQRSSALSCKTHSKRAATFFRDSPSSAWLRSRSRRTSGSSSATAQR